MKEREIGENAHREPGLSCIRSVMTNEFCYFINAIRVSTYL
jgi:hypothetical protein